MLSDWLYVLPWLLSFFLLGVLAFPLTSIILSSLFYDKGYVFSKLLGLVFVSYIMFVLTYLRILPFWLPSLSFSLSVLLVTAIVFRKQYRYFFVFRKIFILEEILFCLMIIGWGYVRSTDPSIHNLEKFMDFGFVQSILKSTYMPPLDIWHPPHSINYYYFGYLMTACITKLSGVPSPIAYNLMISTLVALLFVGGFSIGTNLQHFNLNSATINTQRWKRIIPAGLLSGFLIAFAGNWQDIYVFFEKKKDLLPPWKLHFNPALFPNGYYFPDATRFIEHTIHEFPIYSAVVADLHPHFLNLPFVLLGVSFFLCQFVNRYPASFSKLLTYVFLMSLWLACVFMTNPIDLSIYMWVILFFVIYHVIALPVPRLLKPVLGLLSLVLLTVLFLLFTKPFRSTFMSFVTQIGFQCTPASWEKVKLGPFFFDPRCEHSPFWQLVLLYGFPVYWGLLFLPLFKQMSKRSLSDAYVILLFLFSVGLIIAPEIFYFKDIYEGHYRANTMFKIVFQAFTLFALVSAYVIFRFFTVQTSRWMKGLWVMGMLGISLPTLYPFLAVKQYYPIWEKPKGLDGIRFIENTSKGDHSALRWLDAHVKGQPVILEALGLDYSDTMRVSALTGLAAVEGWIDHEWLWRGNPDELRQREQDIKTMYESDDLTLTRQLLDKYKVKYIFIGYEEKKLYTQLKKEKFKQLGKLVFEKDSTLIYSR